MPEESHTFNSFFGGFAIGACAGAIGYFLYGTDEGRKVKDQLTQEWVELKARFAEAQTHSDTATVPISVRNVLVSALKELQVIPQDSTVTLRPAKVTPKQASKTVTKTKRLSRSAPTPAKKTGLKFKGA